MTKISIIQPKTNRVSVNEQERNVVRSIGLAGGGGGGDPGPAYGRANQAFVLATFASANAANAFAKANTANAFAYQANVNAAAAFAQANSATVAAGSATVSAGAAFDKANTANVIAVSAYIKANDAGDVAISAFDKANTANALAFQASANAAAAFADSNTRIARAGDTMTGVLTMNTYTDIVSITSPPTPAAGRARFYSQQAFGYDALGYINALGVPIVLARDHIALCRNSTGATLTKGTAVYVSGAQGGTPKIDKALADPTAVAVPCIGLVVIDIPNNTTGAVMVSGVLDMNTSAFATGDKVYVSATTPGALTSTAPSHPSVRQSIGVVEVSGVGNGQMLVNVVSINPHEYQGVNGVSWAIGDGTGTIKSLRMLNAAGLGSLDWNPTANRTLTLPDVTDTIATLGVVDGKVGASFDKANTANALAFQASANAAAAFTQANSASVIAVAAFAKSNTAIGNAAQVITTVSSTLSINYALSNYAIINLGHNITAFSVTGWPTVPARLTLEIRNTGAFNITFPTGYLAVGSAPTITSGAAKKDIIVLTSAEAGSNVFIHTVGQNFIVI